MIRGMIMMNLPSVTDVYDFWFNELEAQDHFTKNPSLDTKIKDRFEPLWQAAKNGELWSWRQSTTGRLAEIIVLDQFSRNMYRNQAKAFQQDALALVLAQELYNNPQFNQLTKEEKQFACLPFMHSESLTVHEQWTIPIYQKHLPDIMSIEEAHYQQLKQFGRYPFRNDALNRPSTNEEQEFMRHHDNF